nr:DUF5753 domain-containing protein [Kibdelosporangium phytohabitans]
MTASPTRWSPLEVQASGELAATARRRDKAQFALVAILDEAVLHRQIGGRGVLCQQLDHLVEVAKRPNVTIRVLPFKAGVHPGLHGSFTILKFPIERDPGVVHVEDRIGSRYRDHVEEIGEYSAVEDRLLEAALSEAHSLSVIRKVRKELE